MSILKIAKAEIEILQLQGDSGENTAVKKVMDSKNQRLMGKMGKFKAIISDMQDTIRNSLLRAVNTISGGSGNKTIWEIWRKLKTVSYRGRF